MSDWFLDRRLPPKRVSYGGRTYYLFWQGEHAFSNFARTPFTLNGVRWESGEVAYQAAKIKFYGHEAEAKSWATTKGDLHPHFYKKRARHLETSATAAQRSAWLTVNVRIMRAVVCAKRKCNPYLDKMLLDTGNWPIMEASPYDYYWGIGIGMDGPYDQLSDPPGKNMLGHLWMEERIKLKNSTPLCKWLSGQT
jgi:ribA/ribD-fused uncharacterized protein